MACSKETYEAAKVVCKLTDNIATCLLNANDPDVASRYSKAVNRLVRTILTEDDILQIAKELISEDPRGKTSKDPLEL